MGLVLIFKIDNICKRKTYQPNSITNIRETSNSLKEKQLSYYVRPGPHYWRTRLGPKTYITKRAPIDK